MIVLTNNTGRILDECVDYVIPNVKSVTTIDFGDRYISYAKIEIPHPLRCKFCGAPMISYKCEYCETEYPKFKIVD